MNHRPRWVPGDFLRVDDASGFVVRQSKTRKQWNGLIVDRKDWEAEQPQNYLRAIPDDMSVPDPRPEGADVFVGIYPLRREDGTNYYNEVLLDPLTGNKLPIYREDNG